MRYLPTFILLLASVQVGLAQSTLLESVKQNPNEAKVLCKNFKDLNQRGISATSPQEIRKIAKKRNLSDIDAEILATYVIGLNCPNVR